MKVMIIGAGWSGIQAGALLKNTYGCEVVIFDQYPSVGGTWAKNVAYSTLRTHAAAQTLEFVGFPFPKNIVDNPLKRVPAPDVVTYMNEYIDHVQLKEHLRLNKKVNTIHQVSEQEVVCEFSDVVTGETFTEKGDFVMLSGFGFLPRKAPVFPGIATFGQPVFTSHDMQQKQLDALASVDKPVVVLGGSKTAYETIVSLRERNIPVHWVARKTYWMFNYDKGIMHSLTGRPSRSINRAKAFFAHVLYAFMPKISVRFMKAQNLLLNAHPETTDQAYHIGVIDESVLETVKKVPFTKGEISSFEEGKIKIEKKTKHATTTETINCSAVITCLGTDAVPDFPEFRSGTEKVAIKDASHLFQFSIHHQLPSVYFIGPLPQRGLGMLNGYHSVQHALIYLSKKMTGKQIKEATEKELRIVQKFFKKKQIKPHLQRSISDLGNFSAYMMLIDGISRRISYTKPFKLGLLSLMFRSFYKFANNRPVYRNPTRNEVRKALNQLPNEKNKYGIPILEK